MNGVIAFRNWTVSAMKMSPTLMSSTSVISPKPFSCFSYSPAIWSR
jgi:hypothetical protein